VVRIALVHLDQETVKISAAGHGTEIRLFSGERFLEMEVDS
jgi:hypothetical protein